MRILLFSVACIGFNLIVSAQRPLTQNTSDELFNQGMVLLAHQELGAARQTFADYLERSPANASLRPDASYYVAFCAVTLFHADGEKKIDDFVNQFPGHPRAATAYFDVASFFYQQKNYTKAISYYGKASFPAMSVEQQNTGRFRWGYSLFNQRKFSEALDQFNFIKGQGGQYGPASSYYAGFIEFNNKDYPNALIDLKRAESNDSYSLIVPYMIAQVLYQQKKYDELLTYIKSVEKKEGIGQADGLALLSAEVYYRKGDFANAVKGYLAYMDGNKNPERSVSFRAGYAAMKVGDDQAAIDYFKGVASSTDSVGAYASYHLGSVYLKKNQKPLALNAYDAARKFNGDPFLKEESSFQFGKIAYDLGRSDQAISELEKFQAGFPSSSRLTEVKEILSQAYVNANNYNKAIEYIESLPRRGPSVDRAYQKATFLKGVELFNMERYAEAITFLEKSIQYPLDPAITSESRFWCGEAYSIGRKYEPAIEQYAAVVSPAANAPADIVEKARYGLGYAYFNLKQYDRALYNFKEFVNRASKTSTFLPDGQLRLADCYYVSKSYNEALTTYRNVARTNSPDKDYVHLQSGVILGIQRKYAEASAELEQVIKNYPQSSYKEEALFTVAQLEFEQGKYGSAVTGYSKVIDNNRASPFVPYAYMRRAAAHFNLKEYDQTAADYIYVVENYSTHAVAHDVLLPLQEALTLAGKGGEFDTYLSAFKTSNPDSKGIESVEFESAKNMYFNQEYEKAIQRLKSYAISYPESPRLSEAKYYQAESNYRLKNYANALQGYQEIATDNSFSMINKVVARVAELQYRDRRYDLAIESFRKLAFISNNKKEQYTAWSGLMESHYLLAQYDSADAYAHIILEKGNINAGAGNKASLFLGKTAMARGDYETAKDEFLNTLNTARDEYGAEAKYLTAEIFYLTKDNKQCYETLISLNNDFAAYTSWVGKSFLLLADNFLAMGDRFQARATLKSLENFPDLTTKDRAVEKLKLIDQEEQKTKMELSKDTLENR